MLSIKDISRIARYEVSDLKSKPIGQTVSNNLLRFPKSWTTLYHIYLLSLFYLLQGLRSLFCTVRLHTLSEHHVYESYIHIDIYNLQYIHTDTCIKKERFKFNMLLKFKGVTSSLMHSQSQENIFPREVAESGILETLMMEAHEQSRHKQLTLFSVAL